MKNSRIALFVFVAGMGVAGCGSQNASKQDIGTFAGSVAGGLIGNELGGDFASTALGALVGGLIGNQIGASMDEADRRRALEAEYRALQFGRPGQRFIWRNDATGDFGEVVAGPYTDGRSCRTYTHTIHIGGRPQTARGTACRRDDGTWKVVS